MQEHGPNNTLCVRFPPSWRYPLQDSFLVEYWELESNVANFPFGKRVCLKIWVPQDYAPFGFNLSNHRQRGTLKKDTLLLAFQGSALDSAQDSAQDSARAPRWGPKRDGRSRPWAQRQRRWRLDAPGESIVSGIEKESTGRVYFIILTPYCDKY